MHPIQIARFNYSGSVEEFTSILFSKCFITYNRPSYFNVEPFLCVWILSPGIGITETEYLFHRNLLLLFFINCSHSYQSQKGQSRRERIEKMRKLRASNALFCQCFELFDIFFDLPVAEHARPRDEVVCASLNDLRHGAHVH